MQKTVAVFFGGNSNEHEISVITGMLAVNLLRGADYTVVPVFLPRGGGMVTGNMRGVEDFRTPSKKWISVRLGEGALLKEGGRGKQYVKIDVALNCCHGGMGEDGTLSALLRWHKIKCASPDVPISSVFMDKELSKIAAKGLGLPVLPSFAVREGESAAARAIELGYPVIVKPLRLGSSIGIKVARSAEELEKALTYAFRLDNAVLVEKYLEGRRDLNCAACRMNGEVRLSPVEEVFSKEDILTFSEKYEGTGTRSSAIPADIPQELAAAVQEYTRRLYGEFHGRGVVRADFLLAGEEIYFNELNTVPGSLSCYLFGDSLTQSRDFLKGLVEQALLEEPVEKETVVTGILNGALFSGGKSAKRRR